MILLLTVASLIFAFTVQSAFGFGAALLSIPLLTLVLPITQITPLLAMLSMTLSTAIVYKSWRDIDTAIIWRLLVTASIGVPLGISFLVFVDEAIVKIALGLVVVAVSLNGLTGVKPLKKMPMVALWPFGFVIGVLGGAYNLLGGPLVICLQWAKLEAKEFRATVHSFSLAINIVILAGYGAGGLLSQATITNFTQGLIPMVIGGLIGNHFVKKIRDDQFLTYIYGLLVFMGCCLIFSGYQAR